MIASSTPKTTKTPASLYNPNLDISTYRFPQGSMFAGMTLQEAQNFQRGRTQQINEVMGEKKPSTITGSEQGDQALGLGGAVLTAAGIRYLGGAGSSALGGTAGAGAATTAGAGTAGAGTTASSLGASSSALGSTQLAGTLGTQGAADLSAMGAGTTTTGAGMGATAAGIAPFVAAPVYAYSMSEALPRAYNQGQGQGLTGGIQEGIKPSKGTDYMSYAIDPFFTPQILALAGAAGGLFGSKREGERKARKEGRRMLQGAGLMGQDSRSIYSLADGSGYDIRTRPDRAAYNVDFNEEGAGERVGLINALSNAIVGGKKEKPRRDLTGELYNSYMSNGKFDENARFAFDKAGGRDAVYGAIAERWKRGELNANERDSNFAAIDKLYGIANPNNSRWDAGLAGKDQERNQQELAKPVENKTPSNTKPAIKPLSQLDPNRPQVLAVNSVKKPDKVNPRLKGAR